MLDFLLQPARMSFCEATLDGLIKHPADTWTNIGPVSAGVLVLLRANTPLLKLLGLSAIWMGIASAIFHATDTLGGEMLDLHGMYCFLFMLRVNQVGEDRYDSWATWEDAVGVFSLASVLAIGFLFWPWLGTEAFAVFLGLILISQWRRGFNSHWYWLLGTFAVAYGIWNLDYHHLLCIPGNHILTGHGVWHLLNGVIVWRVFRIYERRE